MSKPIVIFQKRETPEEYFLADSVYRASYARLAQFATERKIDLRFVTGGKNYSQGRFTSSWKYVGDEFLEIKKPFEASMILLKSRSSALDSEIRVNSPFLEKLCRDKYLTYQTFPDFVKKTVLPEFGGVTELNGEEFVLKPRFGSEGNRVQLVKKVDFRKEMLVGDEFIGQELINTSKGIPGLTPSRHEMRIYVFNGFLQSAYLRIPAANSFLTNISQGATVQLLEYDQIPQSAFEVVKKIDAQLLSVLPRLYTIDVMYQDDNPWVVELNDMPGLPDVRVQPLTDNFLRSLLDLLSGEATYPVRES